MDLQEQMDRFYFSHGQCCAGCDWWRSISSLVGECTRSAIVSGKERMDALGIESSSYRTKSGHPITDRSYKCGEFKDDFDWTTLSLGYRKRVGAPVSPATPEAR